MFSYTVAALGVLSEQLPVADKKFLFIKATFTPRRLRCKAYLSAFSACCPQTRKEKAASQRSDFPLRERRPPRAANLFQSVRFPFRQCASHDIVLPVLVGPALEPLLAKLGFRARALFSIIALQREIFQKKCNLFMVVERSLAVGSGTSLGLPPETW